jgi:hypothetical protein
MFWACDVTDRSPNNMGNRRKIESEAFFISLTLTSFVMVGTRGHGAETVVLGVRNMSHVFPVPVAQRADRNEGGASCV